MATTYLEGDGLGRSGFWGCDPWVLVLQGFLYYLGRAFFGDTIRHAGCKRKGKAGVLVFQANLHDAVMTFSCGGAAQLFVFAFFQFFEKETCQHI